MTDPRRADGLRGSRILALCSDRRILDMLREILEEEGARIHVCTDFEAAGGFLQRMHPAAILLGRCKGGRPDAESCRRLREIREVGDLPVLLLTTRRPAEACLQAGADDYLLLPLQAADLRARLGGRLELGRLAARCDRLAGDLRDVQTRSAEFAGFFLRHFESQLDGLCGARETADDAGLADAVGHFCERADKVMEYLEMFARTDVLGECVDVPLSQILDSVLTEMSEELTRAHAVVHAHDLPTVTGDRYLLGVLFRLLIRTAVERSRRVPLIQVGARRTLEGWEVRIEDNSFTAEPEPIAAAVEMATPDAPDLAAVRGAICERIAERHGGSCRSGRTEQGKNALFVLFRD